MTITIYTISALLQSKAAAAATTNSYLKNKMPINKVRSFPYLYSAQTQNKKLLFAYFSVRQAGRCISLADHYKCHCQSTQNTGKVQMQSATAGQQQTLWPNGITTTSTPAFGKCLFEKRCSTISRVLKRCVGGFCCYGYCCCSSATTTCAPNTQRGLSAISLHRKKIRVHYTTILVY